MNQLELHKKIEKILQKNPQDVKKEKVLELMPRGNFDAKNYFFARADKRWLDWLWDNGFLTGAIAKKSEDPTRYNYKTPELRYLVRTAEVKPVKVTEIITKTKKVKGKVKGISATTKDNFNPEVIGQFLRICSELPVRELKKVVPKIKRENWVKLMSPFNSFGFDYGSMFKTLFEANEYETLLDLADVVLSVKTKEEYKKEEERFLETPFYFNDFSNVKVFDYLTKIEDGNYIKKAFSLLTRKLGEIIKLTSEKDKDNVFDFCDKLFVFYDVNNISELKLSPNRSFISGKEDIRNLIVVIITLSRQLIEENCNRKSFIKEVYKEDIKILPDSEPTWRLKLFMLSLCPKIFKKELKIAIFRLFKAGRHYNEVLSEEYRNALQKVFPLIGRDKKDYVRRVIDFFSVLSEKERKVEIKKYHLVYGSKILSALNEINQLAKDEKKLARENGFDVNLKGKWECAAEFKLGTVVPQSPISCDEFKRMEISEIVEKMEHEWSLKSLEEKYKNRDDFSHPINADGVVKCLKEDFPERFQKYINNANLFFDRTKLDPHYTYSFLQGAEEYIRNHRDELKDINWDGLIKLLTDIKKSGKKPFNHEKRQQNISMGLLINWDGVHSAMADVIQRLLEERNGKTIIDFSKYRDNLFEIIKYLLNYPNPTSKDEEIKTAAIKTKSAGDSDYVVSDPFTMAINTVRGRAFRAFVLFVYQDGKELEKEKKKIKIKKDVKEVYEEVLSKEDTRALMFMFGYYLPSFYFRDKQDKKWIKGLLPKIFPEEPEKKNLYTAAWEGYLSTDLYKQMFFDSDIWKLYERGLQLTDKDYPKQKHFRNPDEALADHLALAFVHFPKFVKDFPRIKKGDKWDKLFKEFWESKNTKRHKEFISFIGKYAISRKDPNEWLKQNKINKDKLKEFWSWILEKNLEPDALAGFGFWINPKEEVLGNDFVVKKMAQTIEKSAGKIDWDYGLSKRLSAFAEVSPENTLKIIKNYLLGKDNNLNPNRYIPPVHEGEIKNALEMIYKNGNKDKKQEVINLINVLIEKGSSAFWDLEDIINEK